MREAEIIRRFETLTGMAEDANMVVRIDRNAEIVLKPQHPVYAEGAQFGPFESISSAIAFLNGWEQGRWFKDRESA